jgi:guanosine-3',5'-bis(diphosphate) 3'-pyrophosphohydrolase
LLLAAVEFAESRHRGQDRKGVDPPPYITHPIAVARLLADHGYAGETVALCAAILHDTVEDTDATIEELAERFGPQVASVVAEVTDDKGLPVEARKRAQIEHAPHMSREAKLVKLADKTANVRDLVARPPKGWSDDRRRAYVAWAATVVAGLDAPAGPLLAAFDAAVAEARRVLGG